MTRVRPSVHPSPVPSIASNYGRFQEMMRRGGGGGRHLIILLCRVSSPSKTFPLSLPLSQVPPFLVPPALRCPLLSPLAIPAFNSAPFTCTKYSPRSSPCLPASCAPVPLAVARSTHPARARPPAQPRLSRGGREEEGNIPDRSIINGVDEI